jgi:hypothetical protein
MKSLRNPRSLSVVVRRGAVLGALAAALAVPASASAATTNFRSNALFSCAGAVGGIPTANTANITSTLTTVSAKVTVHAPPGTSVFGQLTQGNCLRLKFFTLSVGLSGTATTTVSDLKISNRAFVWFTNTLGQLQITPAVTT